VHGIEEALAAWAERVLHVSTESILTRTRQTGPIAEDQRVPLADVIGPYCRSKWHAERFALKLGRAGAPVVVVNPTLPVGPGDWGRSPPTQMLLDFCRGKRSAYLDAGLNLIAVTGVKLTRRTMHFDARRSLAELGLAPRPVAQALADAVAWFRAIGWVRDASQKRADASTKRR